MSQERLPEEKLLKIIRNKELSEKAQKKNVKEESASLQAKGAEKENFFKNLNGLMFFIVLILSGFFIYELLNLEDEKAEIILNDSQTIEFSSATDSGNDEQKPYDHYANLIKARDIFSRPAGKAELANGSFQIEKKFRLVGIVLDGTPEAIVEDLETRKTLFLHEGDLLRGSKVEQIQEGKIILSVDDQEVELVQ